MLDIDEDYDLYVLLQVIIYCLYDENNILSFMAQLIITKSQFNSKAGT